jgi:hypothetical protein
LGDLDVAWSIQIALFEHQAVWQEENIGLSVCLSKKKLRLEARVNSGECRRWNAVFEAFSDQSCWMRSFGVLRSHKKCRILKRAGHEAEVRQIRREKAEFLGEVHPKSIQHHARYFPLFLLFVRTNSMNAAVKVSYRHIFLCFELLSHDS